MCFLCECVCLFVYLFNFEFEKILMQRRELKDVRFPGLSILTTASIKPELHSLHCDALIGCIILKDLSFDQQVTDIARYIPHICHKKHILYSIYDPA